MLGYKRDDLLSIDVMVLNWNGSRDVMVLIDIDRQNTMIINEAKYSTINILKK